MIGTEIGPFLIEEQIGAGGMGVVYRARDRRLQRDVAIKLLPPGGAADAPARTRFRQEATLLARVNHPNIATIHDVGEANNMDFLVMELITGTTLDALLADGALPEPKIRKLAHQLCTGLAAAHELGIVHRDLKPANIRLTADEHLKILDFGLAMLFSASPGTADTMTGRIPALPGLDGTLPYMAPEQVSAGRIDARTDIHAVGAVLYEMAAGRRPFEEARDVVTLIGAILGQTPAPPSAFNPRVSRTLDTIILKCLEKDPERRYQSARELALALHPGTGSDASAAAPHSLAVLPFENLSADPTIDYLRFALAETVAAALSRAAGVSVRPLAATRRYASDADLQQVGETLRVGALVTGAFAAQPGGVRISIEAAEAGTLRIIWSDAITVATDELIAVTHQLREAVSRSFVPTLTGAVSAAAQSSTAWRPTDREGHELYLRSIACGLDEQPNSDALALLERAVQRDPGFAPAWSELGRRYYVAASYARGGAAAYRQSERAFQRALALDPDSDEATVGLASHLTEQGDLRGAYDVAAGLLHRRPESKAGHRALGYVYRFAGLHQLSADHAEAALRLDRDSALGSFALTFLALENHERAGDFLALRAGTEWADNVRMQILLHRNDLDEASRIAQRLASSPLWPAGFVVPFLQGCPASEVAARADEYIRQTARVSHDPESSFLDAALLVFCGQHDRGIDLLGRAIRGGYAAYPNLLTDPLLEGIRHRPEYADLVTAGSRVQQTFIEHLRRSR